MADNKINVSVKSLGESQFKGWGTKQGGSWKSWKRRYFVLKDRKLWYFEQEDSMTAKGWIDLPPGTEVKDESIRPKTFGLSINSRGVKGIRTFHINVGDEETLTSFLTGLNIVLGNIRQVKKVAIGQQKTSDIHFNDVVVQGNGIENVEKIPEKFLWFNEQHQVKMLFETMRKAIPKDYSDTFYQIKVNSKCDAIEVRIEGPQEEILQSIVDLFWSVGAPPSEIERLNQLGMRIDEKYLGLWLNLSSRGGLDGGWFITTDKSLILVGMVSDGGKINEKQMMLLESNGISRITRIARDLGVTPPRQAEFQFKVSGNERGRIVRNLLEKNKIRCFNSLIQKIVQDAPTKEVTVSIKTTNFDLVKFSVIIDSPTPEIFIDIHQLISVFNYDQHNKLIETYGNPVQLEISYLQPGFGYEVFDEGLDVSVLYNLQDDGNGEARKYVKSEEKMKVDRKSKSSTAPRPTGSAPPKPKSGKKHKSTKTKSSKEPSPAIPPVI